MIDKLCKDLGTADKISERESIHSSGLEGEYHALSSSGTPLKVFALMA